MEFKRHPGFTLPPPCGGVKCDLMRILHHRVLIHLFAKLSSVCLANFVQTDIKKNTAYWRHLYLPDCFAEPTVFEQGGKGLPVFNCPVPFVFLANKAAQQTQLVVYVKHHLSLLLGERGAMLWTDLLKKKTRNLVR